ncbi:hypothetical protein PN441_04335 [Spirulina major CS-329]|nr:MULTISPECIES: hypothetical protein [Spirulina]MDB9493151.1 hypothetical protein [Spirulina subsalsa CS-330]MDB9502289.1 hypothetical protein [Spirulina major CS-329]
MHRTEFGAGVATTAYQQEARDRITADQITAIYLFTIPTLLRRAIAP